jgi:hypothetical protein
MGYALSMSINGLIFVPRLREKGYVTLIDSLQEAFGETVGGLVYLPSCIGIDPSHHAEGVFDPNPMNKQMVTIFGYPRACRFRKHQFENRSWLLPLPTFFKK